MKFQITSKEFKKAVDRVLTVVNEKMPLPIMWYVSITATDNSITISGRNAEEFAEIRTEARVIESGQAFVKAKDIVKVYNVTGLLDIEVSDGIFSVKNGKKRCEVATGDFEEGMMEKPKFDFTTEPCFTFTESELLFTMDKLKKFLISEKDEKRPILTGYYFDGVNNRIIACDGNRLCVRDMRAIQHDETDIIIPWFVYKTLKKIGNAKSTNEVFMYVDDREKVKTVCFKGEDYIYTTRLLVGEYLNMERLLSETQDFEFTISSDELGNIAKEYAKAEKTERRETGKPMPMYLTKHNGDLIAAIVLNSYKTADKLETANYIGNIPDDFPLYINSQYIMEAAEVFDKADITVKAKKSLSRDGKYAVSGVWFENGEFKCMTLPYRPCEGLPEKTQEFISRI